MPTTHRGGPSAHVAMATFAFVVALMAATRTEAGQACQPVPGNDLEQFYPLLPGWTRGRPQSETDQSESVSRTTVDFDRQTETISVELMDSCRNADVLQLAREVLKTLPPATRGTIQRHTTVNGFPAYEEFTAESGHGEMHVLVAERFMVKVTVESSDLCHAAERRESRTDGEAGSREVGGQRARLACWPFHRPTNSILHRGCFRRERACRGARTPTSDLGTLSLPRPLERVVRRRGPTHSSVHPVDMTRNTTDFLQGPAPYSRDPRILHLSVHAPPQLQRPLPGKNDCPDLPHRCWWRC